MTIQHHATCDGCGIVEPMATAEALPHGWRRVPWSDHYGGPARHVCDACAKAADLCLATLLEGRAG